MYIYYLKMKASTHLFKIGSQMAFAPFVGGVIQHSYVWGIVS